MSSLRRLRLKITAAGVSGDCFSCKFDVGFFRMLFEDCLGPLLPDFFVTVLTKMFPEEDYAAKWEQLKETWVPTNDLGQQWQEYTEERQKFVFQNVRSKSGAKREHV